MENKNLLNLLLVAAKADKLKGGEVTCGAALSSGKTELLILSKDASNEVKTKFGQFGFKYGVEVLMFGNSMEFSWISGKKNVQVLAIIDPEVAEKIKEIEEAGFLY